ncbi:hypothetical protein [Anaplasma marginale]|uniref:hypothetical protein n=1 Tax=Anaplasma marginale TaxID=770 RepID=UPI000300A2CC|nr:hypothetical protein [Anaplasma marginale]
MEFVNEDVARKATNGFADKYTLSSDNAINLFNKPLEELYTKEELEKYDEYFYHLAYPYKANDK